MKISITITAIAFLSLMYLIGKMYCELNSRIEKIEEKLNELEKQVDKRFFRCHRNSIKAFILKCQLEILQEILEGK